MSNDLLSLFEDVQVDNNLLINAGDRAFCIKTHDEFLAVMNNLECSEKALQKMKYDIDTLGSSASASEYGRVNFSFSSESSWFDRIVFTPLYGLQYIKGAKESALHLYRNQIIRYFEKVYNLNLTEKYYEKTSNWEEIVAIVLKESGGSLTDAGIKNLIADFNKQVGRRQGANLKGNVISLPYYWITDAGYYKLHVNKYGDSYRALSRALSYFETGATEILNFMDSSFPGSDGGDFVFGSVYDAHPLCKKWKGFKQFKNNRLDLVFADVSAAREFYEMFGLKAGESY